MAITVNTNIASLQVQNSLTNATNSMNKATERMTTGLKINSGKDDAAGLAVSTKMETQIRGASVAQDNAQLGDSMLTTTEGTLDIIQTNILRIRDLAEQAANGVYGDDSRSALEKEVAARMDEVDRLAAIADFNGISLLDGTAGTIKLQVGMNSSDDNVIELDENLFARATCTSLGLTSTAAEAFATSDTARAFLDQCDTALANIVDRKTNIGASQNRLTSATEGLVVQSTNLTSANSTIKDADIAEESSNYVKYSILQQASASLLVQANNAPSIALSLI